MQPPRERMCCINAECHLDGSNLFSCVSCRKHHGSRFKLNTQPSFSLQPALFPRVLNKTLFHNGVAKYKFKIIESNIQSFLKNLQLLAIKKNLQ